MNPGQFACAQPVLHNARTLRSGDCLIRNRNIVSFLDIIQQNLVVKCAFYCLTVM